LRVAQFDLHLTLFGDVFKADHGTGDAGVFEDRDRRITDGKMRAVCFPKIFQIGVKTLSGL
jgi:hypothetical protein